MNIELFHTWSHKAAVDDKLDIMLFSDIVWQVIERDAALIGIYDLWVCGVVSQNRLFNKYSVRQGKYQGWRLGETNEGLP